MKDQVKPLILSTKMLISLYLYYALTFFCGLILSVIAIGPFIIEKGAFTPFKLAIIGGLGMALAGSSIFYIRKLYKSTLSENIQISNDKVFFVRRLGTAIYFIARPFFSMAFSLLIVVGLKSGFIISSTTKIDLDEGFVYVVMFMSFFVGFLSGKFIKILEKNGSSFISNEIVPNNIGSSNKKKA